MTTVLGTIDVTLYDQQTPITVDNFLRYIDTGAYLLPDPNFGNIAPVFFHRSVKNFVIQAGGFVATQDPFNPPDVGSGPGRGIQPDPKRGTSRFAQRPRHDLNGETADRPG